MDYAPTIKPNCKLLLNFLETSKYRNLIRQHIDLKSVTKNVEEGWYLDCEHKFFRDLLLLVNNVMIFFGKKSTESIAASEVRQLISKKMAQRNAAEDPSAGKQASLLRLSLQSKQVLERSDSLLIKPQIAGIITVCRKRSSIAAKGSASSSGSDRKREQAAALGKDKPVLEFKQTSKSSAIAENNRITKRRTGDGSASSSRSSKKNGKNLVNTDKNSVAITYLDQGTVGSPPEHSQSKSEKKNPVTAEVKKRSAANFLDRLKRTSSLNSGPFLGTSKSSMLSAEKDKGIPEQNRSGSIKGDEMEDNVTKRSSRGRQPNEESSPTKRRLGRPPKRAAAPSSVLAGSKKRAIGDTAAGVPKHPKKRPRK